MPLSIRLRDEVSTIAGGSGVILAVTDGQTTLPDLLLTSTQTAARVYVSTVTVEPHSADAALREVFAGAWRAESIHVPDTAVVPGQTIIVGDNTYGHVRVRVTLHCYIWKENSWTPVTDNKPTWEEDFYVGSPVKTARDSASTTSATPTDEAPTVVLRASKSVHHGFAVIDFGTTASTATLFDQQRFVTGLVLPHSQTGVLRQKTADLLESLPEALPMRRPLVRGEWADLLVSVASHCLSTAHPDTTTLISRIRRGTNDVADQLLHRTLRTLDLRRRSCSEELGSWLADRLHTAYDEALRAPAPDHCQLHEVPLHENGGYVLDSALTVQTTPTLTVTVGQPPLKDSPGSLYLRGVKRHLGRLSEVSELREYGIETDEVIARAVGYLIDKVNTFTSQMKRLDGAPLDRVIVTYPTATPGSVRRALADRVSQVSGSDVDISYDEAVAAAMFFLMRDLGSHLEIGIESLWSRMRPGSSPGRREENTLVIDIGGGTTDIALFTFELIDSTPPVRNAAEEIRGRFYTIKPRLRGSNGRENRGGEYLTLCIFHWMKAALAQGLLTHGCDDDGSSSTSTPSLLDDELEYLTSGVGWAEISVQADTVQHRNEVEAVVPTRWAEDERRRPTFQMLWEMAEDAKVNYLGVDKPKPYILTSDVIDAILATYTSPRSRPEGLTEVTLRPSSFDPIARVMIGKLAALAVELARNRLKKGEMLDRIILTGRASQLEQVGVVVGEAFAKTAAHECPVVWNPAGMVVDTQHAKGATSLGAAWAERTKRLAFNEHTVVRSLAKGITEVKIDIKNIFRTVPASFCQTYIAAKPVVISANDPFEVVSDDEVRKRVFIGGLQSDMYFTRIIEGDTEEVTWGSYRFSKTAEREGYRPAIDNESAWRAEVYTQLELNHFLEMKIHLWRDRHETRDPMEDPTPIYVLPQAIKGLNIFDKLRQDPVDIMSKKVNDGMRHYSDEDRTEMLPALLPLLYIRSGVSEAIEPTQIFPPPGGNEDTSAPLSYEFADSDTLTSIRRAGRISTGELPLPDSSGWTVLLRIGDPRESEWHRLGCLTYDSIADEEAEWRVSVDDQGTLRVHPYSLPFLSVRTLEEMDDHVGAVFSAPMAAQRTDDTSADPHNGLQ